jgi:endonuclease/exonuclease/phosphatase family metal-dependent hydrolase
MRLASFNVENMFQRPVALNSESWSAGAPILAAYAELQAIFEHLSYTDADRRRIPELLEALGLTKSDESQWAYLRRSRGQLLVRHHDDTIEVIAAGRGDWIGWLELKVEAVDEVATRNTARVIAAVDADVIAVVEAEDRPALVRFNRDVLPTATADGGARWIYGHVMLVDGNDDRGIDVGLLTKDGYAIRSIVSHVDDHDDDGTPVFSRDCAEYEIAIPGGDPILVLVNHFKSKGYGTQADNDARRRAQATRVRQIVDAHLSAGRARLAVVGDFNDTPDSEPLQPLLSSPDIHDVSEHASFEFGERRGTFGTGNEKIDYILLSSALFDAMQRGGINRSGVWHGPRVHDPWVMLNTLTNPVQAASDHAAIWCELDL